MLGDLVLATAEHLLVARVADGLQHRLVLCPGRCEHQG